MSKRLDDPRMEYYHHVYQNSQRWDGKSSLEGKKVVIYGEQGYGDIIQFARYIPHLKGCEIVFHCPKELHRLFECLNVDLLDKDCPDLPEHDFHILSLDLPTVLDLIDVESNYLKINEKIELGDVPDDVKKIGIAWEGGPTHENNDQRNCPLRYFQVLDIPQIHLFSLQKHVYDPSLLDDCDDMNLYGYPANDFYDTAKLINSMDAVVTVDTSVLHLAGSLGKLTYALLPLERDPRWDVRHWYKSVVFIKQKKPNDWQVAFKTLINLMTGFYRTIDSGHDFSETIS